MTTRFFISATTFPNALNVAFGASWSNTSAAGRYMLTTANGGLATVTKSFAETVTTNPYYVLLAQFVTEPLQAQTIAGAGYVKGMFRASETTGGLMMMQQSIRVVKSDLTARGPLINFTPGTPLTSEFATSLTNRKMPTSWTGFGTSIVGDLIVSAYDRIIVEIGYTATNTVSTSYTGAIELNSSSASQLAENETDTTQYTPWIEFSQTLLFIDTDVVTSLRDQSSDSTHFITALGKSDAYNKDYTYKADRSPPDLLGSGGSQALPPVTSTTPVITHYYKRAWKTESSGYVYWDTTDPSGVVSGTLYPVLGTVMFTYGASS